MGTTERNKGLYADPEFRATIDEICTEFVGCSSYHRPDVAQRLRPDDAITLRSEKIPITPGIARSLFGASIRGCNFRAGFKMRKATPYELDQENVTIRPVLHMERGGEWSELTVDLPEEDSSIVSTTAQWLAMRLKARQNDLSA